MRASSYRKKTLIVTSKIIEASAEVNPTKPVTSPDPAQ